MGYIQGAYRSRVFLPPLGRPEAGTSRHLDGETRRFELTATGGFRAMPDTMQRVLLLLAFGVPDIAQFSTDTARAEWRRRAIKALRPLTNASPPVITGLTIRVTAPRPGADDAEVGFRDASGKRQGISIGSTGVLVRL